MKTEEFAPLGAVLQLHRLASCSILQVPQILSPSILCFMSGVVCSCGAALPCFTFPPAENDSRIPLSLVLSSTSDFFMLLHGTVKNQEWPKVRWCPCALASLCHNWAYWGQKGLNLAVPKYEVRDAGDLCMQQTSQLIVQILLYLILELVMFPVWNSKWMDLGPAQYIKVLEFFLPGWLKPTFLNKSSFSSVRGRKSLTKWLPREVTVQKICSM